MLRMKKHLYAGAFFLILTAVFMGPAILEPTRILYGNPGTPYTGLWWGWWAKYSSIHGLDFLRPLLQGAPFGADYTYYPIQPMYWIYRQFFIIFNEVAVYNTIIFLSIFLSALSAYVLAYFITRNSGAGVVAGIIFSFSPFHLMESTMNIWLSTTQWIPLYFLLIFMLIIQSFNGERKRTYIPILGAALFALILFENYYYGYMAFLLTVLIFGLSFFWRIYNRRLNDFIIKPWLIFCIFFVLFSLPVMSSLWTNFQAAKKGLVASGDYVRSAKELIKHGARWYDYVTPPKSHPLWGKITNKNVYSQIANDDWSERELFVGIIPALLAVYAVRQSRKKKIKDAILQRGVYFFSLVTILSIFLSFQSHMTVANIRFPLASYFLYKILPMFRVYSRFGIFAMLGISILAAIAAKQLSSKGKYWQLFATPILIILIIFEFINFPSYPVIQTDKIPPVYKWLRDQPGSQIVAEYPLAEWDTFTHYEYLFWQRYHQKPLFNGIRPGTDGYQYLQTAKILNQKTVDILSGFGIRYIIVNRDFYVRNKVLSIQNKLYLDPQEQESLLLSGRLKLEKVFNQQAVYRVVH